MKLSHEDRPISAFIARGVASLRLRLKVAGWAFYARYRELAGYPGWFLLDILIPIFITALPILLSRSAGASAPAASSGNMPAMMPAVTPGIFQTALSPGDSAAFLLIGANVFLLTLRAFWDIGLWLENEVRAGTLDVLSLAPFDRRWIVTGIALFNLARGLVNFFLSIAVGCVLFKIDPFQGSLLLAVVFLAAGAIPLYALSLLYGALVLRFKESGALVQMAQSLLALLMGLYYPVSVLPPLLRGAALLAPPTWITHDMRAAILHTGYLLNAWPRDLAVLLGMSLLIPPLANIVLQRTERSLRQRGGFGES
jgi:ABC-2 type transport system permease protein